MMLEAQAHPWENSPGFPAATLAANTVQEQAAMGAPEVPGGAMAAGGGDDLGGLAFRPLPLDPNQNLDPRHVGGLWRR